MKSDIIYNLFWMKFKMMNQTSINFRLILVYAESKNIYIFFFCPLPTYQKKILPTQKNLLAF